MILIYTARDFSKTIYIYIYIFFLSEHKRLFTNDLTIGTRNKIKNINVTRYRYIHFYIQFLYIHFKKSVQIYTLIFMNNMVQYVQIFRY